MGSSDIQEFEGYFELLQDHSEAITFADLTGTVLYANPAAYHLYGYEKTELIGLSVDVFNSGLTENTDDIVGAIKNDGVWSGELIQKRKDGSTFYAHLTVKLVFGADGSPIGLGSHSRDITLQKQERDRITQMAFYDPLTQLPNRSLLKDRLEQAIVSARRSELCAAVMFIDLDGFKAVNDNYGHPFGDTLLKQVAGRIRSLLREEDTVARLSGDEFIVIIKKLNKNYKTSINLAERVAEKIRAAIFEPFVINEQSVQISCSLGVCLFNKHFNEDTETLIARSDQAMYRVKNDNRNGIRFFDSKNQRRIEQRQKLETELLQAITENKMFLEYQPIAKIETGEIKYIEALLRWSADDDSIHHRTALAGIAESNDLILYVDLYMIETLFKQAVEIPYGAVPSFISQVSIRAYITPQFITKLLKLKNDLELEDGRIVLVVDEAAFINNRAKALATLAQLYDNDIYTWIDNYSGSHLSLHDLAEYPIKGVRLSVATNIQRKILKATQSLSKALDIYCVADRVESEELYQLVNELGLDYYQGKQLMTPQPIAAVRAAIAPAG